jgi:hypothetical protein
MKKFHIIVSGIGTPTEISDALIAMAGRIDNATEDELANTSEWEDETLIATILETDTE